MKTYRVGFGGRSIDTYEDFEDIDDAKLHCLELAREHAINQGDDAETVDLWGDDEDTGWGACPENDDGGYWPHIVAVWA